MDRMDAIRNRRAVRDYTDKPVDRSPAERLIDAAILAPSAMNLQPWAFAVLLGRAGSRAMQSAPRIGCLQVCRKPLTSLPSATCSKTPNMSCSIARLLF
jgi:hypothetical protein